MLAQRCAHHLTLCVTAAADGGHGAREIVPHGQVVPAPIARRRRA